jgi:hypothetical protein
MPLESRQYLNYHNLVRDTFLWNLLQYMLDDQVDTL